MRGSWDHTGGRVGGQAKGRPTTAREESGLRFDRHDNFGGLAGDVEAEATAHSGADLGNRCSVRLSYRGAPSQCSTRPATGESGCRTRLATCRPATNEGSPPLGRGASRRPNAGPRYAGTRSLLLSSSRDACEHPRVENGGPRGPGANPCNSGGVTTPWEIAARSHHQERIDAGGQVESTHCPRGNGLAGVQPVGALIQGALRKDVDLFESATNWGGCCGCPGRPGPSSRTSLRYRRSTSRPAPADRCTPSGHRCRRGSARYGSVHPGRPRPRASRLSPQEGSPASLKTTESMLAPDALVRARLAMMGSTDSGVGVVAAVGISEVHGGHRHGEVVAVV